MPDSTVLKPNPTSDTSSGERGAPVSLAQQAALLPERMRNIPVANLFLALEISPGVDADALNTAVAQVVSRHEILRTVYPAGRRIPTQQVVAVPEQVVEVVEDAPHDLTAALAEDAEYRFDLVAGPPVRFRLYRRPDCDVLSIALHPVCADDRSLDLLPAALCAAYDRRPAPEIAQYRTFAAAQLRTLAAEDEGLTYWCERLAHLPERAETVSAPADPGRPGRRILQLSPDTVAGLTSGVSLESALVAVLAHSLREAGLGESVAVGILDADRAADSAADALGSFANHLVVQVDTSTSASPRESIAKAAELVTQARAHAGTRIERIIHALRGAAADGMPFHALVSVRERSTPASLGEHRVQELAHRIARPHGVDIVLDVVTDEGATLIVDFSPALAANPGIHEFARNLDRRCTDWAGGQQEPPADGSGPVLFSRDVVVEFGATGLGGPPRTEPERLLVQVIRDVLELDEDDEVGRADTFFSLGGDSIAALRLATVLSERGYAVDVQDVFEFPAIRELAEQLTDAEPQTASASTDAPAVAPMSASGLDAATLQALGRRLSGGTA